MDTAPIRDLLERRRNHGSTHYDGCEGDHIDCAAWALLAEVERLRDAIIAHDRAKTYEGGGIARCSPVLDEIITH